MLHLLTQFQWARTARITFYGGFLFGPVITKWFQFLSRLQFSSPTKKAIYSTTLDQAFVSPGVVAFFFTSMTLLEGKKFVDVKERLSKVSVSGLSPTSKRLRG